MKHRDLALLLLPCLLLGGFGITAYLREKAARTQAPLPQGLIVADTRFENLTYAGTPDERVKITARVKWRGQQPRWWGHKTFVRLQNMRFVSPSGKEYPMRASSLSGGNFDRESHSYFAGAFFKRADLKLASWQGRIKATVIFPDPTNQLNILQSVQVEIPIGETKP